MKLHEIHKAQEQILQAPIAGKFAVAFLMLGVAAITVYAVLALGVAGQVGDYFSYTKQARDTTLAGSTVLGTLSVIRSTGAWLEPLKFVGLSFLIFGIAISFAMSILRTLRIRLQIMGEFVEVHTRKK